MITGTTPRRWNTRYEGDEADCVLVSSRGLMKLCDLRTRPRYRRPAALPWFFGPIGDHHGCVYVDTDRLEDFAKGALKRFAHPFTLVSGDSDSAVGWGATARGTFEKLTGSPLIRNWYTQNYTGEGSDQLRPLPIGLDYHTLSVGLQGGWGAQASPAEQEAELQACRQAATPLKDRKVKAHSNAHLNVTYPARAHLVELLDPSAVEIQSQRMPRRDLWRVTTGLAATVSPRGKGMDCHRTYEALVLGSIPLVDDVPTNALLKGLPHRVVKDWGDLSQDTLKAAQADVLSRTFDFAPLLLAYWEDKLNQRPTATLSMTYQTFMDTPLVALKDYYLAGKPNQIR